MDEIYSNSCGLPHKGGPSNGLRSVWNRRGVTKQGSLLRVCSRISDKENDEGVRSPLRQPHPLFVAQAQGCFKCVIVEIEARGRTQHRVPRPPGSPLSSNCKECGGSGASGIWLSTVLNIHTKDRFISHCSVWIKN